MKNPFNQVEDWLQRHEGKSELFKQFEESLQRSEGQPMPRSANNARFGKAMLFAFLATVTIAAIGHGLDRFDAGGGNKIDTPAPSKTVKPALPQVGSMVRLNGPTLGCPTSGHVLAFADFVVANEHTDKSLWTLISEWNDTNKRLAPTSKPAKAA